MKYAILTNVSKNDEACLICSDMGFTETATHTCPYCESEMCDRHFEDGMCSACFDVMEGRSEWLREQFNL